MVRALLAMRARRERGPFCISPPLSRQQGMIRRCCCCCGLLSCLQAPLWFRRKRLRTKYYTCTRLLLEKVQVPQVQNFIFVEKIFFPGYKTKNVCENSLLVGRGKVSSCLPHAKAFYGSVPYRKARTFSSSPSNYAQE